MTQCLSSDYLHSLVERSTSFEKEVAKRNAVLREAQDELDILRARVSRQRKQSTEDDSRAISVKLPDDGEENHEREDKR